MKTTNAAKAVLGLTSIFYDLAIASHTMSIVMDSFGKTWGKEKQRKVRNLKRKGLILVEIIDKKIEETYHLKSELKNIELFVKRNKEWKLEKDIHFGIKTGGYILTRIYRNYHKKHLDIEDDVCPKCGGEL